MRLVRDTCTHKSTMGKLYLDDDIEPFCDTLELPWRDNKINISCIPTGSYALELRSNDKSTKFPYEHLLVQDPQSKRQVFIIDPEKLKDKLEGIKGDIDIGNGRRTDWLLSSEDTHQKLMKRLSLYHNMELMIEEDFWRYEQLGRELTWEDKKFVCASGRGDYKNDPLMDLQEKEIKYDDQGNLLEPAQVIRHQGPIPKGEYKIHEPDVDGHDGYILSLEVIEQNVRRRDHFQIYDTGDYVENLTSCMVFASKNTKEAICKSEKRRLIVVGTEYWSDPSYWRYEQSTGKLFNPERKLFGTGYSGSSEGKNNPEKEEKKDIGSIPRGKYKIRKHWEKSKAEKYIMTLEPDGHNALGRTAFQIHGDYIDVSKQGTASTGCIIFNLEDRKEIWDSDVRNL